MESLLKILWAEWNIRGAVLLSLFLQLVLNLLSHLRKRCSHRLLISTIWLAYLLADVVATFSIGMISRSLLANQPASCSNSHYPHADFLSLWAPFLLVHLGNPDNITAFAMEDNQLWLRHLLNFAVQTSSILYITILSSFNNKSFIIPTYLVFFIGLSKYSERIYSLYLASKDKFRDDMTRKPNPGLDYDKGKYRHQDEPPNSLEEHELVTIPRGDHHQRQGSDSTSTDEFEIVRVAYEHFTIVKGLLAGLILGFDLREASLKFFQTTSAEDALRVLEVELNFAYDILYTKVVAVHSTWGKIARPASFSVVLAAFMIFQFQGMSNGDFSEVDVTVSYLLLYGALSLDLVSFLISLVTDWAVVGRPRNVVSRWFYDRALVVNGKFLNISNIMYGVTKQQRQADSGTSDEAANHKHGTHLARPFLFRRWCRSVPGFSFMTFCVDEEYKIIGLQDSLNEFMFKKITPLTLELWEFIFLELKSKSNALALADVETARKICYARGEVVFHKHLTAMAGDVRDYVMDYPYDKSLLVWHIATELLLYNDRKGDKDSSVELAKELSRTLSDYMLYLLIMQPTMMATVSGVSKIRFADSCAEARRFFKRMKVGLRDMKKAYAAILGVNMGVDPDEVNTLGSTGVFFIGRMLAKKLSYMPEKEMWELISEMWAELMSYAAINCENTAHCQQLCKGGELLTYVWLMMAQFGLSVHFEKDASLLRMSQDSTQDSLVNTVFC